MLAKLRNGFYLYSSDLRADLLATNCISAWIYSGKIPPEFTAWVRKGRPFIGYEIEEDNNALVLRVDNQPELSFTSAELHKVLPIILSELSLKENKRQMNPKQEAKQKAKAARIKDMFATCTMKNVALKVAYLGWKYSGLARQINTPDTVEEILLQACEKCCLIYTAKDYKLTRCGRTDKGVSAFSQVISLYLRSKGGDEEYDYISMINNVLPPHIRILAWSYVGLEFDSRFQVLYRSYKYFFPRCDLNIDLMRKGMARFIGTHNFRGFCKADRTVESPNYMRTISYLSIDLVTEDAADPALSIYSLTILGHAFLWHQIRNMVSVLLRIGLELESPKVITNILEGGVKYNYGMASELPLVLQDCEFENVSWSGRDVDLSKLWFESAMKTTLIKQLMTKEVVTVKGIGTLCDNKLQSILSRPFIT